MRAILLGASNLRRGLQIAIDAARQALGQPALEVMAALGHGRSYGRTSHFFGRAVPGILDCGLWRALEARPEPACAVLTDIGNDVGYGVPAAVLAAWIDECLRRLADRGATRLVLTAPPTASLERRSDGEIEVARRLFFPFSTLGAADVRREVAELDRRLREVAARRGATWVEQEPAWYGVDPIHVLRRRRAAAWQRILASWNEDGSETAPVREAPWQEARLWIARPERYTLFGRERRRAQPAVVLPGPSPVHLF